MADYRVPIIEKILTYVDGSMRRRLTKHGLDDIDHIIPAIAPDGAGVVRTNCGPHALMEMARMLVEIAGQVELTGEGKLN